ncbi:MAG TPA: hypothetical protein VG944_22640, partial [Fimbriimonas sp.]|nr:hypothetical protein [Fimbriimonas sp.]
MVPEVAKRNEALRARKEAMAQRILGMDDRKRATQPSDGGFSPAELVAHMAKAEEFNLAFLRKVGPSGLDGRRVKPGVLYGHVLKSFQARKRI